MEKTKLILATRRSPLALKQTELASAYLKNLFPDTPIQVLEMTTTGDRQKSWSLETKGGKGLFTKELEDAVLRGDADLAIHSAKDLPTEGVPGLSIAGFLPRESVLDVLACREGIKEPREIATSSPRRRSQAKVLFPQVCWNEIRGNVETRLKKIRQGHADATILAAAGLRRLDLMGTEGIHFRPFAIDEIVPAAGQGAIALQCREEDAEHYRVHLCVETGHAVTVERMLLDRLGGGCHTAIGVHFDGVNIHIFHEMTGLVVEPFSARDAVAMETAIDRIFKKHFGSGS